MFTQIKELTKDWAENQKIRASRVRNLKYLTMCKQCYTFYYKNSWHFEKPELLEYNSEAVLPVKFTQCPMCVEQENALFEDSDFAFSR